MEMTGIDSSEENLSCHLINSYVTIYFIFVHGCECDALAMLTCVFIFVGRSLVVDQMYRSCDVLLVEWDELGRRGYFR